MSRLDPLAGYPCRCGTTVRWEPEPWAGWPRVVETATGTDHTCPVPPPRPAVRSPRPLPGERALARQARFESLLDQIVATQAQTESALATVAANLDALSAAVEDRAALRASYRHHATGGAGHPVPPPATALLPGPPVVLTAPPVEPRTSLADRLLFGADEPF